MEQALHGQITEDRFSRITIFDSQSSLFEEENGILYYLMFNTLQFCNETNSNKWIEL